MKTPVALASLLLLLPSAALRAQAPSTVAKPAPDYRSLFEAANAAGAKWRDRAQALEASLAAAEQERETARKERDGARKQLALLQPAAEEVSVADPSAPNRISRPRRKEFVMEKRNHRLIEPLNEFVTFLGADALAVHMTIGPGTGTRQDFTLRRGLEGSGNNETLILDDGHGHRLLYMDTIRRKADSGVFVVEESTR